MSTEKPKGPEGLSTAMDRPAKKQETGFPEMLAKFLPEIKKALPSHLNGDRMARIALTAFRRNPQLGKCDPRSVFAAVIQASQLGLEIDTQGRAFLVPYREECQFIPGWRGLVDLMNRSREGTCFTGVIYEGQKFRHVMGDRPGLVIEEYEGAELPEKIEFAYAVGWVKGAQWPVIERWSTAKIKRHRDQYNKVGDRHYSFKNWEMYCRKVVLLQVLKYMPCSAELMTAMELSTAADLGAQRLDIGNVIDGTWTRPAENEPEEVKRPEQSAGQPE
jgi:recombination protein RecT